jgi:hypothetical protein
MWPSAFSTSGTVRGPHFRASKTDLPGSTDSAPTSNPLAPKWQDIYFLNDVLGVEKSKTQLGLELRFRQRFLAEIGIGPTRRERLHFLLHSVFGARYDTKSGCYLSHLTQFL